MISVRVTLKNSQVLTGLKGQTLFALLSNNGIITGQCGGKGLCGHCRVSITEKGRAKEVLSCKYVLESDITVDVIPAEKPARAADAYGGDVFMDLGSTFIKAKRGGLCVETVNPQRKFGNDVMSRISACKDNADELFSLTAMGVNEAINALTKRADRLYVTANTVMNHLLMRISPITMGEYPYRPVFLEGRERVGTELGINAERVITLPCASAFIGSDAIAGFAAQKVEQDCLYVDLGTNAEIMINSGGIIYAASAAAGSVFERVGGGRVMREAAEGRTSGSGIKKYIEAKAAIAAATDVILSSAGLSRKNVKRVIVAGGVEFDERAAVKTGLFAAEFADRIERAGNCSLKGAAAAASIEFRHKVQRLAERTVTVDLIGKRQFAELFIKYQKSEEC